jgi:hypothetical protein
MATIVVETMAGWDLRRDRCQWHSGDEKTQSFELALNDWR